MLRVYAKSLVIAWLVLALIPSVTNASQSTAIACPRLAQEYLSILTTYGCHAKSLWHEDNPGGFWGDGITAKNQNGAVRGMSNTLLTYAMLARGLEQNWIAPDDAKILSDAGLTREALLDYIRKNLGYLVCHHKSASAPVEPTWGFGWQTSLWIGAAGSGVMLVWKDLPANLRQEFARAAASEADVLASKAPKSNQPGDTGAEENGWNCAALALALAVNPNSTSTTAWSNSLKVYAVNTLSVEADRTSQARIGSDTLSDLAKTASLLPDYSLINHNFFHPDYVQVSIEELGQAWLLLKQGDQLNGTSQASKLHPYLMHNVETVWNKVLMPLTLPTGELLFPSGNDWTYHCSTNQSCFAFIANALNDPFAAQAEQRALQHVRNRRAASPPGRLLGDSNIEWWWEPLVCKRATMALLHHMLWEDGFAGQLQSKCNPLDSYTTTVLFPDVKVWLHRNPLYAVSVSWRKPVMATFTPLGKMIEKQPYWTIPISGGILPMDVSKCEQVETDNSIPAVWITTTSGTATALVCLPNSAIWLSETSFGALALENDSLTSPGRILVWPNGSALVPALITTSTFSISGTWLAVDDALAFVSPGGFTVKPAGRWNRMSVAVDILQPDPSARIWQMLPNTTTATAAMVASKLSARDQSNIQKIRLQDGADGSVFEITVDFDSYRNKSKSKTLRVERIFAS